MFIPGIELGRADHQRKSHPAKVFGLLLIEIVFPPASFPAFIAPATYAAPPDADIPQITSFDVNKAIQRSLTKAVARHGLGLYIYAGEDLPIDDGEAKMNESLAKKITKADADKMTKILSDAQKEWVLKTYHVAKLTDLTNEQYGLIMRTINERLSKDEG